jgi:hypothetical protein
MNRDDARVRQAVVASEIRDLKMEYAQLCDAGYDGRALGELFTDDAVWDGAETFGRHEGRPAIETYFSSFDGYFTWALHYMIGPRLTKVSDDGGLAEAVWYLWMPHVQQGDEGGTARLLTAKQYDRYRLTDGRWRFEEIRVVVESNAPMEQGWSLVTGVAGNGSRV